MHRADLSRYRIEGYTTPDTSRGYDAESEADTLADARKRARHLLSEDYRQLAEAGGRLSYARVVDTRDQSCPFDVFRAADRVTARAAAKLNDQAVARGLYLDPPVEGVARVGCVRVALGYPRDLIELRDAYREDVWITLSPAIRLFNQRGEALDNPVS